MPAADRAEAEGILDRIDLLATERQRSLARLHHVEQALRRLAEQGQPLIRDGQPVADPHTGQVLKIRRSRARCGPRSRSSAGSVS